MALYPSNPKWIDVLMNRVQKDGTWANRFNEKQLDVLETLNLVPPDGMKLEVDHGKRRGDAGSGQRRRGQVCASHYPHQG